MNLWPTRRPSSRSYFRLSQSIASHLSTLFYVVTHSSRTIQLHRPSRSTKRHRSLAEISGKTTLVTRATLTKREQITFNLRTGSSAEKLRRALALVPHLIHRENGGCVAIYISKALNLF